MVENGSNSVGIHLPLVKMQERDGMINNKRGVRQSSNDLSRYYLMVVIFILAACTATPTPALVPTVTITPTVTASPTSTPTPTQTPTSTPTPEPEWYQVLDASYSEMEYRYGTVTDPGARRYSTVEDALVGNGNYDRLPILPAYVAILGEESREGRTFYRFNYGWMEADKVELLVPSTFRGMQVTREVDFRFGWVLEDTTSVNAEETPIQAYSRYQVVHEVPAVTDNPGYIAIGADEWLPAEKVALTDASLPEDAGVYDCHFVHVNLSTQIMRVFHDCQLVFATLVSTGREPAWTYPGRFSIQTWFPYLSLTAPSWSTSVYYQEAVPHFMTYIGDLGFHGAYWHDDFGKPVSHGCINLSPADAKWLYEWAEDWMGATVIISK
jgi:lipoprotein-anchoring transpeptidase ErfK/SrfK